MTSRELVKNTIKFSNINDRIPLDLNEGILNDYKNHYGETKEYIKIFNLLKRIPQDIFRIAPQIPGAGFAPPANWEMKVEPDGTIKDEWGTIWKDEHPVRCPLMDLSNLKDYRFPDPDDKTRLNFLQKSLETAKEEEKYCIYWYGYTLFERISCLMGFENHLISLHTDIKTLLKIRDKIMDINYRFIEKILQQGFDGIFIGDDLGSQNALLINPQDWRKYYKPCYQELFDLIKRYDTDIWMHSDGNIMEIVPDLLDLGLNVLNPVQPQVMNVRKLGQEFGGKLAFHGGLDVQYILPRGSLDEVEEHINFYFNNLGKFNGGYIPSPTNRVLEDVSLSNLEKAILVLMKKAGLRTP